MIPLHTLNTPQQQAVENTEGPLLVLAGAGTGKTKVLTTRLAFLLANRLALPHNILAVTFTNKAAREMRDRVGHLVGGMAESLWLGTFHSISVRFLRRHAEAIKYTPDFTIIDSDDQQRLCKQLLQAANIDEKKLPPRVLLGIIQRWKDRALTPDKVPADEAAIQGGGKALLLYQQYQQRLQTVNAMDFGDLLLHCITLFMKNPDILQKYQAQFRYLLVDEYQDTNVAQYLWLRLLAQGNGNICCVGDDDQSIYGWRGAQVENILRFEKDFVGAKIIRLEQNYRSTPHILGAAGGLIAHNQGRLGKTLWTDSDIGEKVQVQAVWDGAEEARAIGEEIENLQRRSVPLSQMAVLVRAGYQTREFEERFMVLGLPYRVIGGLRFYERQEIKDALAYFRLVAQPKDDLAFERIINVPKRGIGNASLQELHSTARANAHSLFYTAAYAVEQNTGLRPQVRSTLQRFIQDIERWRSLLSTMPHGEWAQIVLDESGYTAMWQADKSLEAQGRLENLKELVAAMEEFGSLAAFLEHVSLVTDTNTDKAGEEVTLMTLHAAKGLEFDSIFLPGWEEGVFPNQRAIDESGEAGLEEERRLAYVGITRAKQRAYIYHASNRRIYNQWQSLAPSRFIKELPEEHIHVLGLAGIQSGAFGHSPYIDWGSKREQGFHNSTKERWNSWQKGKVIDAFPAEDCVDTEEKEQYQRDSFTHYRPAFQPPVRQILETPKQRNADFAPGENVKHAKYGSGKIIAINGDKLEIRFAYPTGVKKVMVQFVEK